MTYVPLEPGWGDLLVLRYGLTMSYLLPGTTTPSTVFAAMGLAFPLAETRTASLSPLISPVRDARVRGVRFFDPIELTYDPNGTPLPVTFSPAEGDHPAMYTVAVYRLNKNAAGTSTRRELMGRLHMAASDFEGTVHIPSRIIATTGTYFIQITTQLNRREDTELPIAQDVPGAFASTFSNIVTLVPRPASCLEARDRPGGTTDGKYAIDPDGPAGPIAPFSVYCDMTTAGGGWTLTARWTGADFAGRTHAEVCGASGMVRTTTDDGVGHPVPPDDLVPAWGTTCLVKPGHPTFVSMYGSYFTYAVGAFDGPIGIADVVYAKAGKITSISARGLWPDDDEKLNFGILPATDNQGLCGGPYNCGTAACPSTAAWSECHWDQVNITEVYRR